MRNARRHQSCLWGLAIMALAAVVLCSTPEGIRAVCEHGGPVIVHKSVLSSEGIGAVCYGKGQRPGEEGAAHNARLHLKAEARARHADALTDSTTTAGLSVD